MKDNVIHGLIFLLVAACLSLQFGAMAAPVPNDIVLEASFE